mgnify:CR=1 FL=1
MSQAKPKFLLSSMRALSCARSLLGDPHEVDFVIHPLLQLSNVDRTRLAQVVACLDPLVHIVVINLMNSIFFLKGALHMHMRITCPHVRMRFLHA